MTGTLHFPGDVGGDLDRLLTLIETAHEHGDETAIVEQAARVRAALTPSSCPGDVGTVSAAELQETFDMRWNADMRAVAMWRAENPGNDLVLPDHADLVVWLLDQADALSEAASRVLKSAGKWTPDHYELSAHVTTFRDAAALTPSALSGDAGEVEKLREALEPFAEVLDDYDPDDEDDAMPATVTMGSVTDYSLTLGDFRAARAALPSHQGAE